ncbi:MAG: hypothetical protein R3C11_20415 [Planctomycetaceae bacterium]
MIQPPTKTEELPLTPEIKEGGKQPKAVTEQTEFDFGKQAQYQTGHHTFKIYNKGRPWN